jgi:hypothetical protein
MVLTAFISKLIADKNLCVLCDKKNIQRRIIQQRNFFIKEFIICDSKKHT